MKEVTVKIRKYKGFNKFVGFSNIKPVNIVIGKNNTGKSSLVDIIEALCDRKKLEYILNEYKECELIISKPIQEQELKKVFSDSTSGGDIHGNHWEFGKKFVNEIFTYKFIINNKTSQQDIHTVYYEIENGKFEPNYKERWNSLARVGENPFANKKIRRVYAERNIVSEKDDKHINIKGNGEGATNIVNKFINLSKLDSRLVEVKLLAELNNIMGQDATFTDIVVQQIQENEDDITWEIFLEEKNKGRVSLSNSGSGLKTIIIILINILLIPEYEGTDLCNYIFVFEELENNLHPSLQRRLFKYIELIAKERGATFFITTHSNVVIDLFSNNSLAQIYHVQKDEGEVNVSCITQYPDLVRIIEDLGIKASDILQSNGVVWVEGPSDRIFFKKWVEIWSNGQIREGEHYQCIFYGGRLLSHFTASRENSEFINLLMANRNSIVLIDSDKRHKGQKINSTKLRIKEEMEQHGKLCWITKGKEIENYLPKDAILKYLNESNNQAEFTQFDVINEYLDRVKQGEGKKFLSSKVEFAHRVVEHLFYDNLKEMYDLDKQMKNVLSIISFWNSTSSCN